MNLFKDHGTKLIGSLSVLAGALGSLDPTIISDMLGQKGLAYITALTGVLTILRGFQNGKNPPAPPSAP